jgi:hypothetical protein
MALLPLGAAYPGRPDLPRPHRASQRTSRILGGGRPRGIGACPGLPAYLNPDFPLARVLELGRARLSLGRQVVVEARGEASLRWRSARRPAALCTALSRGWTACPSVVPRVGREARARRSSAHGLAAVVAMLAASCHAGAGEGPAGTPPAPIRTPRARVALRPTLEDKPLRGAGRAATERTVAARS